MAETTYTYNITNDLPSGACNTGSLHLEIAASVIATQLVGINSEEGSYSKGRITGGTLYIIFADTLSAGDKTILDGDTSGPAGGLLAAHNNAEDTNTILVSGIDSVTTTSTDYVVIPNLTATPVAGTYIVTASGTLENDSRSKAAQVAIFSGGTQITHSNRKFIRGNQQQSAPFTSIAKVTVNGSEAIEVRWKVDNNSSGTITERSLLVEPE